MIRALITVSAAVWAHPAAASFHPVEDRPYRYDTVETRDADGVVRRFHASRAVVFHKTASGYDATVTLDALDQQAGGDIGAMFLATSGALLHRPLRYRLDGSGAILDVADVEATIALIADAIERGSRDRARTENLVQLATPLRTLPPERKRAMLVSILAPLIAGAAAGREPGERAVSVPSRPPLAPGTALAGVESLSRNAAGLVTIRVHARGGIDAAPPRLAQGAAIANVASAPVATIDTVRNVDPATGLVIDSRSTGESILSDGTAVHRSQVETSITLRLDKK